RGEVATEHFGTLHIHDLRIGGGLLRYREKSRRIESKPCGKDQSLSERHAVEAKDQIDGELGAPAVADASDMEAARKQDRQHRLGLRRDIAVAADQPNAIAAAHLLAGAGDWRFQKPYSARHHAFAERGDAIGIAGAGAEHDLA